MNDSLLNLKVEQATMSEKLGKEFEKEDTGASV